MDPLVDIQEFATSTVKSAWNSMTRIWSPKSARSAKFYGRGSKLRFDRGEIESPLVYVCEGISDGSVDASLIESGLRVGRSGAVPTRDLPYWPSYRAADPDQRAYYIDWILAGRTDPEMPIGYVFLYFYGLERRVLADGADHFTVAAELVRLLKIYGKSRTFARYCTRLIWTTMWFWPNQERLTQRNLTNLALRTNTWSEEILSVCLACFARNENRLPVELAYLIASHDLRSVRSVITQRHPDLHKQAFRARFQAKYPDGMELKASRQGRSLEYFAASATLGRLHDRGGPLHQVRIPNVMGLSSQFQTLIEMWSESIDDLKAYDRAHKKFSGGEEFAAEMYEALPENLRHGDHPHFEAWYNVMMHHVTADGWTIVPVKQIAAIEEIPERKKLTKTQSIQIAVTASHMGIALEPDPRITGKAYSWDDLLSVFPATEELKSDLSSYHAAATFLELGVVIAAADGSIDEVELGRLASQLEAQFDLSPQDAIRLDHLRHLLTIRPPQGLGAAFDVRARLSTDQRRLIGEFLVGIAAADEIISPEEIEVLRKAYRALGLDPSELNRLVQTIVVSPNQTSKNLTKDTFKLDVSRISSIMTETTKVAEFLRQALLEDFDGEAEIGPSPAEEIPNVDPPKSYVSNGAESNHQRFQGLDPCFVPFILGALQSKSWRREELEQVARRHNLMLGRALEMVNEWAADVLPDVLFVECNDRIDVQNELLE